MNTLEWKSQDVQKNVSFETPLYRFGLALQTARKNPDDNVKQLYYAF